MGFLAVHRRWGTVSGTPQLGASLPWAVNAGITCQVPWKIRSCSSHSTIARTIGSLAFGILLVGHLAGPHPSGGTPQMRVSVAAPEHGDHLDRLHTSAVAGGGVPLLGPGQLPVSVGSAVAILANMLVDRAIAAQERRVGLLEDPPHHRINQAHGAAENIDAFRPLAGTFIGAGAKIGQMAEDVRRPGRQILSHATIMHPALSLQAAAESRQVDPRSARR